MTSVCVAILIGIPASGKTTFAEKFSQFLNNYVVPSSTENYCGGYHVVHICYDSLIPREEQKIMCETKANNPEEPMIDNCGWKASRKSIVSDVQRLLQCLKQEKLHGKEGGPLLLPTNSKLRDAVAQFQSSGRSKKVVVLVDDNNYYRSMRYEYFRIARDAECGFCQFYLRLSPLDAVHRNQNRTVVADCVPREVVMRMSSKIEAPNPLENLWEQFSFVLDSSSLESKGESYNMCLAALEAAFENPFHPTLIASERTDEARECSRQITNRNLIHRADNVLRRMLKTKMERAALESTSKDDVIDVGVLGRLVNDARVKTLRELKKDLQCSKFEATMNDSSTSAFNDDDARKLESLVQRMFEAKLEELSVSETD